MERCTLAAGWGDLQKRIAPPTTLGLLSALSWLFAATLADPGIRLAIFAGASGLWEISQAHPQESQIFWVIWRMRKLAEATFSVAHR